MQNATQLSGEFFQLAFQPSQESFTTGLKSSVQCCSSEKKVHPALPPCMGLELEGTEKMGQDLWHMWIKAISRGRGDCARA